MRRLGLALVLALALAFPAKAGPVRALGYRPGTMDWSHLEPRPEAEATPLPLLKKAAASATVGQTTYPARYDLRVGGYVTPARDQTPFGCCWAFASCAALESAVLRNGWGEWDFSERNMALAVNTFDANYDWYGFGLLDQGGENTEADAYLLSWMGPVLESDDPYPPQTVSTPDLDALELEYGNLLSQFFLPQEGRLLTLRNLMSLEAEDWRSFDVLAEQLGYGAKAHTNFVHDAKISAGGRTAFTVPHINRNLLADEIFRDCPSRQGPWTNRPFRLQATWRLPRRSGPLDNDTYKYAIYTQGAVSTSYYYDEDYEMTGKNDVAYWCPDAKDARGRVNYPNHQIVVIGWDDDFARTNFKPRKTAAGLQYPAGDGAFLVKNSWGEGYGDRGCFWVSYYDAVLARSAEEIGSVYTRVDSAENGYGLIHSYDTLGLGGSGGIGSTSATAANIFKAGTAETLRAVGTYLLQWNTKYTVKIYAGCTAGKPTSGTLVCTKSGRREFPGYETIDLDADLPLAAGELFSVVVTLTTPGYKFPIPLQYDYLKGTPYSAKKRSYLHLGGSSWSDYGAKYDAKRAISVNNCPKTFCCKAYADRRDARSFDGDAPQRWSVQLADGSTLTIAMSAASSGKCTVSAKIVKGGKTLATFAGRKVGTADGVTLLRSSTGKMLRLSVWGDELNGNSLTAVYDGAELAEPENLSPNIRGYEVEAFRVGVAARGKPMLENGTGKKVTWTAKNLPTGVTINPSTGELRGVPQKAVTGTKSAQIIASAEGGGSDAWTFTYAVAALDAWARGTFVGGSSNTLFTVTVGSTGKLSGKVVRSGMTWSLNASGYSGYSAEDSTGNGAYSFAGQLTNGKQHLPVSFALVRGTLKNCTEDMPTSIRGELTGLVGENPVFAAKNLWGAAPYSTYARFTALAASLKFTAATLPGLGGKDAITLKFSKSGTVVLTGAFAGVKDGKAATYRPTLSTTLLPQNATDAGAFAARVHLAFPAASSYRFQGFAAVIDLLWDDFRFVQQK